MEYFSQPQYCSAALFNAMVIIADITVVKGTSIITGWQNKQLYGHFLMLGCLITQQAPTSWTPPPPPLPSLQRSFSPRGNVKQKMQGDQ